MIVVRRVKHRLRAARDMGADVVIELEENSNSPTCAIKEVLDLTDGKGTTVSIIATPNPDALEVAVESLLRILLLISSQGCQSIQVFNWIPTGFTIIRLLLLKFQCYA